MDDGSTTLTSPVFDLSGAGEAIVTYARWYTNDAGSNPGSDTWLVEISDNGVNWEELENTTQGSSQWVVQTFVVSDFVSLTDSVQVRFTASDLGAGSVVEAGVDAFSITTVTCSADADEDGP